MDLEQLLEAQRIAQQLAQQGRSEAEINQLLRDSNLPVNTVGELGEQIRRSQQARQDVQDEGVGSQALAALSQGVSAGFAGDLFRLMEKLPGTPDDLDERHAALLEKAREEHPILSGIAQVGGTIGGVPGRVAKGSLGLLKGLRGAGAAAGAGAAGLLGAGRGLQTAGQVAGGAVGAGVGGAALGGAEAAAVTAGGARSRPVPATVGQAAEEGASAAPWGALLGGGLSALGGGVGEVRGLFSRAANEQRDVLEAAVRRESQLPSGSQFRQRLAQTGEARRAAYAEALADGVTVPEETASLVMKNPAMRRALERTGSQEAETFLRKWQAWDRNQGIRGTAPPEMSAQLLDDVRKQVKNTADTFQRASLGDAPQRGAGEVREAQSALSQLDEHLDDLPGFREAQELARLEGTQARAWEAGQKWMGSGTTADEMAEELAGLPGGAAANEAARVGAVKKVLQRIGGRNSSVASFVTEMQESPEMRRKMKLIIGDEQRFQNFLQEVETAASAMDRAELAKTIIKYGGFTLLGSSLAGVGIIEILGG